MQGLRNRPLPIPPVDAGGAALAWAALAVFVLYGSVGPLAVNAPRAVTPDGVSWPDIAQNVLLYIPFGILGMWSLRRSATSRAAVSVGVIAMAFIYSAAMELLQTLSPLRTASPLDVIANVIGGGTGVLAARQAEQTFLNTVASVRSAGVFTAPARYMLAAALAAVVLTAWYPFDVTLDVSTLSDRTRAVRLDPWLWPGVAELWQQSARFFVVAALLTACLPGLARRAAPTAALTAAIAALVIDLGQLLMGSQPVGVAAWLSQSAGACAAAVAAFILASVRGSWYAAA